MSLREGHNEPSGYARLRIRVIAGINLAKKDIFGASDPYVKGYIYNWCRRNYDSPCFQTKTIKKSLNPKWDEEFVITVNPRQHKLLFEVFDENRLTRDDFLGEVPIILADTTILHEQTGIEIPPRDFILQPRSPRSRVRGHLRLYLAYISENEEEQESDSHSSESSQEASNTSTNADWEVVELTPNEGSRNSLPAGWEERIDLNGRTYYVDHSTRSTTWLRPDEMTSSGTPQQRQQEQEAAAVVFRNRHHVSQDDTIGENFEVIALDGSTVSTNSSSSTAVISVSEPLPMGSRRSHGDDEEPLPAGWNQSIAPNGRIFFIDHNSRITTWDDPRKKKSHPNGISPCQSKRPSYDATNDTLGPLPAGWEERITDDNRIFYVDHATKTTQWEDPRLKKLGGPAMRYSMQYKKKYDNFRAKLRKPENVPNKFDIKVSRSSILEDSYRGIMAVKKPELLKTKLWIEFEGETGLDYAGVSKEWFYILSKEMFNPYYGLFEYSAIDDYTLQINPQSGLANEEHLSYFRFIGRICGMAVYHGRLIDAYFIRPFYKMMLHRHISLKDMESVDSEYFNSLQWILENEPDCLELTFSVDEDVFGDKKEVELKENGRDIKVTNENKGEYIQYATKSISDLKIETQLIIKYRFSDRVKKQMHAFMDGFNDLIPQQLLSMFDPNELELLLAGLQDVDVNDWKAYTKYKGGEYNTNHPVIINFWKVVYLFNNEQRSRLLQFVTGTSRVPMNGFAELYGSNGHQPFTIEKWGTPADLPRAHTCFNRLDLPPYSTLEELRAKLLFAIENTEGFDGVD